MANMDFTVAQIKTLLNGLTSLEGALNALREPLPEGTVELRSLLLNQERMLSQTHAEVLTTQEVAALFDCSLRRVRQMGLAKEIQLVKQGRRGRGFSNLYDAKSVKVFKKQRVRLGVYPKGNI